MQCDVFRATGRSWASVAACTAALGTGLMLANPAHGALHFWDNGGGDTDYSTAANWDPDAGTGGPRADDLAVHDDPALPNIDITSNVAADSLRMSNGGGVNHTAGTLTIESGQGPDNGLWVGEFGPDTSTYTLDGGDIQVNDAFDGLQVGRSGGSDGVFDFNSGTVTQVAPENELGATVIGLDGNAQWNQSGGTFNGDLVQVGLFTSPTAELNLSGDATFNAATAITLSEAANDFESAESSTLSITGSDVSVSALSFKALNKGIIEFTADANGVSPIQQTDPEGVLEFGADGGAPELDVDLSALSTNTTDVTLIDAVVPLNENIGGTLFDGLSEGATVPGTDGRTITYSGGADGNDIVLQGVPEPTSLALLSLGGAMIAFGRRKRA
jgi:hypothetical protein